MAAKSTSSSSSSARPRRRSTKKKSDEDARSDISEPAAEEQPVQTKDEDFGAGLPDEKAATDEIRTADENRGDEVQREETAGDESPKHGEGISGTNSEDGETTRRRRRRRRRRRPDEGAGDGRAQQHHGQRNQQQQQQRRGRRGSGQGQQRGGRPPRRQIASGQNGEEITGILEGVLELHPKGYGFLRSATKNYMAQDTDAFVSSSVIEKHALREGLLIRGDVGSGSRGQGPRLKSIETVDGRSLEDYAKIKFFDDLTPINPFEQIKLERGKQPVTMRVMDLLTPIGKGQRALLVAPPRTGKTMLLHDIAESISTNHPEIQLKVLLIDERPEEVTEIRRTVRGEVIASSMDRDVENHVRISQLIVERAKRIAESGDDVVLLLDSVTRTARAFNKWVGNSGRTGTGGLDVKALDIPRKMFGTARRFDEGGSLTVIATALIDTGSRMDEAIFQEFKGTGNMELVLSRQLADRRIWPAMDIGQSGTRREEKILDPKILDGIIMLRRSLISLSPVEAMEQLISTLDKFPTNAEFLEKIRQVL